ncbi:cupin domain-containing protein [Paenibacillus senegalimassiliensis]|uniref:cupin domain-containing protein n=1 Tax=Paenibacillus senegalimassiliensis TaxID=1737426 RepID=UPI00073E7882|nr:cupin domain-containing protein [Paenibacillus senegalimassiliensis]
MNITKISRDNAEHFTWGDHCDGWRLVKSDGLSVIHESMPAGTFEVKHYHQKARQFFFILSGTATMIIDEEVIILEAKEGVEIPPLVPHQMLNKSTSEVEFMVISQPNSSGDRINVSE